VFGGKSTVRGVTSGTASSVAFTPLQGLEIVNPMAAEKKVQEVSSIPSWNILCVYHYSDISFLQFCSFSLLIGQPEVFLKFSIF